MTTLSNLELQVLQFIWSEEEAGRSGLSFSDIHKHMGMVKQTVMTYLTRAAEKGYIRIEGEERKRLYYSALSRIDYIALFADDVMPGAGDEVRKVLKRNHCSL